MIEAAARRHLAEKDRAVSTLFLLLSLRYPPSGIAAATLGFD